MPLNDLTYAELTDLRRTLDHIWQAAGQLMPLGDVRMDLTPGARMCIMLPTTMPALAAPMVEELPEAYDAALPQAYVLDRETGDWSVPSPPPRAWSTDEETQAVETYARIALHDRRVDPSFETALRLAKDRSEVVAYVQAHLSHLINTAVAAFHGIPPSGPRADADDAADTPQLAEPPLPPVEPAASDAAAPETGGAGETDGGSVSAAAPEPSVSPAATQSLPRPPKWTPEEDDELVSQVVQWVRAGRSRHAAAELAANAMGRPVQGTRFRCKTALADRIAAALAAPPSPAVDDRDQTAGDHAAPVTPAEDVAVAALPPATAATQPAIDPALAQHIAELPRKSGWTLQRDIDLLTLMTEGWGIPEIAQDLNLDGAGVKSRWDVLSDLHEADEGRKLRSWTKEQLLPALLAIQPPSHNHAA